MSGIENPPDVGLNSKLFLQFDRTMFTSREKYVINKLEVDLRALRRTMSGIENPPDVGLNSKLFLQFDRTMFTSREKYVINKLEVDLRALRRTMREIKKNFSNILE
jgi:hypothetical protein